MKKHIRLIIRKLLHANQAETISDALDRYRVKIEKLMYDKKYSLSDFRKALISVGLQEGDIVMVHASWRRFYNFLGTPEDIIALIKEIIGPEGTLLMPSYGQSREYFDILHTPSNAGVLSEIFRNQVGVERSACTHFSIAGIGPHAPILFKDAFHSKYGFDEYSPYYKLHQFANTKILYLGLGSAPNKVSMVHCAAYRLSGEFSPFKNLLSRHYTGTLIIDGKKYKKSMIMRANGCKNNKKVFQKIASLVQKQKRMKLSNLDLVLMEANDLFNQAITYILQGHNCYLGL
ncbi:MAG: AAC(3) family N-acetyltransferase [Elusimicrobiaceae bacterium]|nr:AAC(3) family N-acetyltransferase [Elusimicrobiaceae bacterium]